jgi:hypothetical protein
VVLRDEGRQGVEHVRHGAGRLPPARQIGKSLSSSLGLMGSPPLDATPERFNLVIPHDEQGKGRLSLILRRSTVSGTKEFPRGMW